MPDGYKARKDYGVLHMLIAITILCLIIIIIVLAALLVRKDDKDDAHLPENDICQEEYCIKT
ncbi:hypothetical protein DPMN_123243, partial [Dreissena polymorpha]